MGTLMILLDVSLNICTSIKQNKASNLVNISTENAMRCYILNIDKFQSKSILSYK